jgi:hypothetical protein
MVDNFTVQQEILILLIGVGASFIGYCCIRLIMMVKDERRMRRMTR